MTAILAIARRELDQYFSTPIGWVALTAFLAVTGFFFAFSLYEFQEIQLQLQASMQMGGSAPTVNDWLVPGLFGNWAIILLLVAPALTMRLVAEDVRQRSFALLLSSPVSSTEIVLGKFLGVTGFLVVLFATTLYQPLVLFAFGAPDPGIIATGYLAMFLLAWCFAAVGLLASSLTDNQFVAFMVSFAVLLVLFVLGWFADAEGWQGALGAASVLTHIEPLLKGLVHLEDLVYFASVLALMLFATQQRVEAMRWSAGLGGASRTASDLALDLAAGFGLLIVISKAVRIALQGTEGLTDGTGSVAWLVLVGLGLAGLGAWAWRNRQVIADGLAAPATRMLAGSVALVSVAVGITVAANLLAGRHDRRWDATASQLFSLSDQTLQVLAGLEEPVEVVAFFDRGTPAEDQFRTLAEGYASPQLSVRVVDPQVEPMLARQHEVTDGYGTVVLTRAESTQRITGTVDEEALTNALIRVTSEERHTLCLTTGHHELDPDDAYTAVGMGLALNRLRDLNYDVETVLLAREGQVKASCDLVIVAGPQSDLLPAERAALARFVVGGGQLFVLLDPVHAPETAADLLRYGIAVADDLVLEDNPAYQVVDGDPSYVVLDKESFSFHPITEPLAGGLVRTARSVAAVEGAPGVVTQELVHTTAYGWGETAYQELNAIAPTPGVDRLGPVPLVVVAEVTDPGAVPVTVADPSPVRAQTAQVPSPDEAETEAEAEGDEEPTREDSDTVSIRRAEGGRVVVAGDTDFLSNGLFTQFDNADLFLNAVAWLVGEEDQVTLRKTEAAKGSLNLSGLEFLLVALVACLGAPGVALVSALAAWRRRRGR